MIRINLYKKNNIDMNLLIGTFEKEKFNMPFYNRDIELHKGVDETIEFSVRNHDRKAQILGKKESLKFVAINQELQQKIEKTMDVVNANLGRYSVTLTKDELNDYDCGTFIGHVCVVDEDENEELLYSGVDWYPYFNVEILPNKVDLFEEAVILTDEDDFGIHDTYTDDTSGITYEQYCSSLIQTNKLSTHTFNVVVKDFVGDVYIQGSNMETPEHNEDDWFNIKHYSVILKDPYDRGDDIIIEKPSETEEIIITPEKLNTTLTTSAELNALYCRVKYVIELDSDAKITEVTYRN